MKPLTQHIKESLEETEPSKEAPAETIEAKAPEEVEKVNLLDRATK